MKQLIAKGAIINHQEEEGQTALILAANGGHKTTVMELIANGAMINHQDKRGHTALMAAANKGHETTVEHLSNMGADHNLKSKKGFTAAQLASEHKTIVKYFSDCPMNPIEEFYKKLKVEGKCLDVPKEVK